MDNVKSQVGSDIVSNCVHRFWTSTLSIKMSNDENNNIFLRKVAKLELNEDPNTQDHFIDIIREWICNQSNLKGRTGEYFF